MLCQKGNDSVSSLVHGLCNILEWSCMVLPCVHVIEHGWHGHVHCLGVACCNPEASSFVVFCMASCESIISNTGWACGSSGTHCVVLLTISISVSVCWKTAKEQYTVDIQYRVRAYIWLHWYMGKLEWSCQQTFRHVSLSLADPSVWNASTCQAAPAMVTQVT